MGDLAARFAHLAERNAGKDGNQKHLQQVAGGERTGEGGGNDGHQMRHHAVIRCLGDIAGHGFGAGGPRLHGHAHTRMSEMGGR